MYEDAYDIRHKMNMYRKKNILYFLGFLLFVIVIKRQSFCIEPVHLSHSL